MADFTSGVIGQLGQPTVSANQFDGLGKIGADVIDQNQQQGQDQEAQYIGAMLNATPEQRQMILNQGMDAGVFDEDDSDLASNFEQYAPEMVSYLQVNGYEKLLPDSYRQSGKTRGRIIEGVDEKGNLTYFQDTPQGIRAIEGFSPPRQAASDIKYQEWLKKQQQSGDLEASNIEKTTEAQANQAAKVQEAKSAAVRSQGFIDSGIEAADALGNLKRTRILLDDIKTGGLDNAIIKGKQYFGIESADEGELSARLGKSVLAQLKPIFGSAFTAQEGQRLEGIEARLGANAETNKRLIEDAYKITERAARRGLAAAKKSGDDFTYNEIKSALDSLEGITLDLDNAGGASAQGQTPKKTIKWGDLK